jgi:hypothetical protein
LSIVDHILRRFTRHFFKFICRGREAIDFLCCELVECRLVPVSLMFPRGDIVGDYLDSGGVQHGFLFGKQHKKK